MNNTGFSISQAIWITFKLDVASSHRLIKVMRHETEGLKYREPRKRGKHVPYPEPCFQKYRRII